MKIWSDQRLLKVLSSAMSFLCGKSNNGEIGRLKEHLTGDTHGTNNVQKYNFITIINELLDYMRKKKRKNKTSIIDIIKLTKKSKKLQKDECLD